MTEIIGTPQIAKRADGRANGESQGGVFATLFRALEHAVPQGTGGGVSRDESAHGARADAPLGHLGRPGEHVRTPMRGGEPVVSGTSGSSSTVTPPAVQGGTTPAVAVRTRAPGAGRPSMIGSIAAHPATPGSGAATGATAHPWTPGGHVEHVAAKPVTVPTARNDAPGSSATAGARATASLESAVAARSDGARALDGARVPARDGVPVTLNRLGGIRARLDTARSGTGETTPAPGGRDVAGGRVRGATASVRAGGTVFVPGTSKDTIATRDAGATGETAPSIVRPSRARGAVPGRGRSVGAASPRPARVSVGARPSARGAAVEHAPPRPAGERVPQVPGKAAQVRPIRGAASLSSFLADPLPQILRASRATTNAGAGFEAPKPAPDAGVAAVRGREALPMPTLGDRHANVIGRIAAKTSADPGSGELRSSADATPVADAPPSFDELELLSRLRRAVLRLVTSAEPAGRVRVTAPGGGEVDVSVRRAPDGTTRVNLTADAAAKPAVEAVRSALAESLRARALPVTHVDVQAASATPPRQRKPRASSARAPITGAAAKPAVPPARAHASSAAASRQSASGPEAAPAFTSGSGGAQAGGEATDALRSAGATALELPASDLAAAGEGVPPAQTRASASAPIASVNAPLRPHTIARAVSGLVVRALAGGSTEARLVLNPPDLGQVRVRISEREGSVRLTFEVQNAAVRESFVASQPQLQDLLERQGLKVAGFAVDVDHGGGDAANTSDRRGGHTGSRAATFRESDDRHVDIERSQTGRVDVLA